MRIRNYDTIPAISNSWLSHFKRSPMHYVHARQNPPKPTDALRFGIAFHVWTLEGEARFNEDIVVMDETQRPEPDKDYKTKVNREWKANFHTAAAAAQKLVITVDEHAAIKRMSDAVRSHEVAGELITALGAKFENKIEWEWQGQRCKALLDFDCPDFFMDLKKCRSADPAEWQRDFFKYEYYRQVGMYSDGLTGGKMESASKTKPAFYVAVEDTEPHAVCVYRPNREVIWHGVEEYRSLTEQFASCVRNGMWPGYEYKSPDMSPIFDIQLPYYLRD